MSKTYHFNPKSGDTRNEQLQRINRMRGSRRLTHREREQMRERAFTAVFGRKEVRA